MDYPTIATFLHARHGLGNAFDAALDLARRFDSHLRVIAPGIDRTDPGFYYAGVHAVALRENVDLAKHEIEELRDKVTARLAPEVVRHDLESRLVQLPALGEYLAERIRLCDLGVLASPYGKTCGQEDVVALESVLFLARAPVYVMPDAGRCNPTPRRVLVAWNESDEALHAIRAALPFLRAADLVDIVIIDPPRHASGRSDPGGALASYLTRHGVSLEIAILARTEPGIANILIRRAEETGAELVVMGAYGHTRMREAIIGGATRHMLENSPVPLFMAH